MADEQPQLHDLTKLLLDRMKTYPEEFFAGANIPDPYKWRHALQTVENYGRPEDKQALHAAYMDHGFQAALKTLLVPEEEAQPVGQSSGGVSFGVSAIGRNVGPSLTQQQAQALMQTQQVPQVRANSVTISPNVARAMGLKPPTVNETFVEAYERIKKRLGL